MKKRSISIILILVMVFSLSITAFATKGSKTVQCHFRNIQLLINGETVEPKNVSGNSVEPFLIDGTTYLPVRAVAEALGCDVSWDDKTSTVIIDDAQKEQSVYITRTGSKYHYDNSCNGGTYWAVPFSTATGMGLKPCDKCVH